MICQKSLRSDDEINDGRERSLKNVIIMAALRSRCGHHIFALWFLLSSFLFFLA